MGRKRHENNLDMLKQCIRNKNSSGILKFVSGVAVGVILATMIQTVVPAPPSMVVPTPQTQKVVQDMDLETAKHIINTKFARVYYESPLWDRADAIKYKDVTQKSTDAF